MSFSEDIQDLIGQLTEIEVDATCEYHPHGKSGDICGAKAEWMGWYACCGESLMFCPDCKILFQRKFDEVRAKARETPGMVFACRYCFKIGLSTDNLRWTALP